MTTSNHDSARASQTANEPVVKIDHLTKRYGDFCALDDLTMHVKQGQILGFIGPNGAGKTTTIKILVGLSKPTSGSAWIDGVDCSSGSRKIKQVVGYMPDKFGSYDNMRVHEYLDFFAAAYGIPKKQRADRIDQVLDTTLAEYMRDRFVESLSHGMQQRVGIARVLLHDPKLLILDEPANGLDPQARIEMRELLLKLAASGKTLIVTSHILPELSRICDTVAIITGGKLRAFGSLEEVMRSLCPKRTFEVQLADRSQLQAARKHIENSVVGVTDVAASAAEGIVRFSSQQTEVELAHYLAGMIQNHLQVAQFREVQSDLEDAFLSVAAKGKSESPTPAAKDSAAKDPAATKSNTAYQSSKPSQPSKASQSSKPTSQNREKPADLAEVEPPLESLE